MPGTFPEVTGGWVTRQDIEQKMSTQPAIRWIPLGIRWTARITGLLLVALIVVSMVGEGGPPNILRQPFAVQLELLAMLLMVIGLILGWRWEALGGGLAVGSFALLFGTEIAVNGRPPGGAIPLFAIPGVLLLISHVLARRLRSPTPM